MKTRILLLVMTPILAGALSACGFNKGWQMDYGKAKAHFHAHDVASKGHPYMGKKIAVKGKLVRVEDREDGNHLYLEHGIHCIFPTWHWGEDNLKPGEEIYVSGFLEKCEQGDVLLKPALKRDPTAPFEPVE